MFASNHLIGFGAAESAVVDTLVTINSTDGQTSSNNYTFISRDTAVLNSVTVTKIGQYSTTARNVTLKLVKRNSANNYDVVVSQVFAHGGTGWEDCTLSSPYVVAGAGTFYLGSYYTGAGNQETKSGALRAYVMSDLTGTGVATTAEDTGTPYCLRYWYH